MKKFQKRECRFCNTEGGSTRETNKNAHTEDRGGKLFSFQIFQSAEGNGALCVMRKDMNPRNVKRTDYVVQPVRCKVIRGSACKKVGDSWERENRKKNEA